MRTSTRGDYTISRPFDIATKADVSEVAEDFIGYIMSEAGQQIIEDENYIKVEASDYTSAQPSGKIVVGGSSSVSPVMEKLIEAYKEVNPNATVEIETSDSSSGMTNTIDGVYDIGMASRELKDSELEAGLTPTVIANDGIVVIVNNANPTEDMSAETVKQIFAGEILTWDEI